MRNKLTKKIELDVKKVQSIHYQIFNSATLTMVIICVLLDTTFIYQFIDKMFATETQYMSILCSAIVAIALDGLPVLIAFTITKTAKTKMDIFLAIASTTIVVILVATLFTLRFSMMELTYSTSQTELVVTSAASLQNEETEYIATVAEKALTVMMSFIPVATSILSFGLACMIPRSVKAKNYCQYINVQYHEIIIALQNEILELKRELTRKIYCYEEAKYKNRLEKLDTIGMLLKVQSRQKLAERLSTPEATTEILECGKLLDELEKKISKLEEEEAYLRTGFLMQDDSSQAKKLFQNVA